MNWKIVSFSKLGMPLPPRKSGYGIGVIENAKKERLMVQIDKKYYDYLKIGAQGRIERIESANGTINSFIPNNFKEKTKAKVALVTGSTTGLGKAIALELAREGFTVIANSERTTPETKSATSEIKKISKQTIFIQADVSDSSQVNKMVQEIIKKFGKIDVLVNNSGIAIDKTLENMTDNDWSKVIAVNLTGVFNCTRATIPYMREQGFGRVVSMSSVSGETGTIGKSNYAASKAGIIAFTKSIAQEYAGDGITVNAIAPGLIKTKMVEAISTRIIKEMVQKIPVGHLGEPTDIANIVAYLASEKAGYITGQVFNINGGLYM